VEFVNELHLMLRYDPGSENENQLGNLCAVGSFRTCIELWDLDIVDAAAPAVVLGPEDASNGGSAKRRKKVCSIK
jgi:hypothetical protein